MITRNTESQSAGADHLVCTGEEEGLVLILPVVDVATEADQEVQATGRAVVTAEMKDGGEEVETMDEARNSSWTAAITHSPVAVWESLA